jgi:hypothetical protein
MARTNPYMAKVRATIAEHGVCIQFVGAGDDELAFAYTVGLGGQDQPEFLVFNLGPPTAAGVLNDLARRVLHGEAGYSHGDTLHHLVRDFPVRLVRVADSSQHLTVANRLYRGGGRPPIPALQIVLPDEGGRWPWQDGNTFFQPLLGPVPGEDEGVEYTLRQDDDPQ